MTIALALILAMIAVLIVLQPLMSPKSRVVRDPLEPDPEDDPRLVRRDRALAALKEIDFDRETGKLSTEDYDRMKTQFTAEALEALKSADEASSDDVEVLVSAARSNESARQRFCLECGMPIVGSARFCLECGTPATASH